MLNHIKSLLLLLTIVGCSNLENAQNNETAEVEIVNPDTVKAVCVWNNISVRSLPSGDARWLTALSLGEEIESTQIIEIDSANENREYVRVLLADKTEGWALSDFIIVESIPVAVKSETPIFERPDLLTKTDKVFSPMDILAVKQKQDDWLQVVGRKFTENRLTSGWIKSNEITENKIDIAFAKFAQEALIKDDKAEKLAALDELLKTEELYKSVFYASVERMYNQMERER
jgi:hypothetical protein